jgi:endonuclease/exonuclease/phosphatase (EEP) superfamily protein YafD
LPWYFGGHRATALTSAQPLKLLLSNVYTNNQSSGPLLELIAKEDPDLIVLEEVDARWAGELRPLTKRYPVFDIVPRSDNFGIGMWTRLPNATVKEVELDEAVVSSFVARFPFRGKDVAVLGVHTVPPVQASGFELRNVELGAIAGWARSTHGNAAVLGDLNLTPFSPFHRRLVRESGLENARQGFGIVPSWPTYVPILYIPLDQCLVSSGIAVRSIRTGPKIGSDHLPLIVELEVE